VQSTNIQEFVFTGQTLPSLREHLHNYSTEVVERTLKVILKI
jgi:hypothetical protein